MTLDEELIKNAWCGNLDKVRDLLRRGANVNAKDRFGKTALIDASDKGHLDVVRILLNHNGVDVNIKDEYGNTALILASWNGHLEVVRVLLNHDGVDVNIKDISGYTALDVARRKGKNDVARLLEEHMEREKLRNQKERNPHKKSEVKTPTSEEKRPSTTDVALEKDQKLLLHVMNTSSADPVELSLEYIERCIKKNHKLGSGGYGDVFLAEDSCLPKKFAVKTIRTNTHCSEAAIKELRRSFHRELSTLKTYRHPNIVVLYGYSLTANSTQHCLVYEYAAHGSLAGFFTDDGNRARLSADTRLSIMFELTRAVHFLHTGGCKVDGKGWNVFHRDIKSANICLADDFTPRLIDCGLAKFVPDDESSATPGSSTVTLQSTTGGFALGTPGYMCPVYVKKKGNGHPCPYIAAYDVYSIGIVLAELILGCLNGVRSTRNDSQFLDVFEKYVQEERAHDRIVDGWKKLMGDADPTVMWNPHALEIACRSAIHCMDPFPEERLSTKDLLRKLSLRHPVAESAVDSGPYCLICNEYRTDIKCSEGHALCTICIMDMLGYESDSQLKCLIKECSSQLQDTDLYGRIPIETYNRYIKKRVEIEMWDKWIHRFESQLSGFQSQLVVDMHGSKEGM